MEPRYSLYMTKICTVCEKEKPLTEYSAAGAYKGNKQYRGDCKVCNREKQSANLTNQVKYRSSPHGSAVKKAYKQTRKYKDAENARQKEKYHNDPKFALKKNLRDRLSKALKSKKWIKGSKFSQYIGCDLETLKKHFESKFKEGMTWDNYGNGPNDWVIDHITPLASAETLEQIYELCHYTNLQPLWRIENSLKSDKIV